MIGAGKSTLLKYTLVCDMRGYYQIGPTLLETGDLFGLHRRHRVVAKPRFLLVLPKVIPLPRYDFASQRPIGEINVAHRLFEDPTGERGVRPYQVGDPLERVHWRATARTGELMCRVFDATTLAATILLDFHKEGYHSRGEPYRSELAITVAASISYAVTMLNQQVGFASNGRDAVDRLQSTSRSSRTKMMIRLATKPVMKCAPKLRCWRKTPGCAGRGGNASRDRAVSENTGSIARLELSDGTHFVSMLLEMTPRLPARRHDYCHTPARDHRDFLGTWQLTSPGIRRHGHPDRFGRR